MKFVLCFVLCLVGVLGALVGSCVKINGGAVEVSWVVHANGRAITDCTCASPEIASVRIDVVGHGGSIEGTRPCAGSPQCVFPCGRQTGATPFDIPPTEGSETYSIGVVAVGPDGGDLPEVMTPAPIARQVVSGQPTEVEAFLLEAGCAPACETMNNSGVCARP
jgi:hypothetical protein